MQRRSVIRLAIVVFNILLWNKLTLVAIAEETLTENFPKTGSWANCTATPKQKIASSLRLDHPDSAFVTISCTSIHYRIQKSSLFNTASEDFVIGVLSAGGGDGPTRRMSIRSTWGYRRKNVFFIVAGPWEFVEEEYIEYGDLLWIDKEEIYITETSVLTFKTESFLSIIYQRLVNSYESHVKYLVKVDDDSYVDIRKINYALFHEEWLNPLDYWGKCNNGGWKPHRNKHIPWQKKWYISVETYPFSEYPPYCQGAGFALSTKFLDCAIGQSHISRIIYMPNEDVAVGLLAERCGISVTNDERVWIRWEEDGYELTMDEKIIQHYVNTEDLMRQHHQSATGVRGPVLTV